MNTHNDRMRKLGLAVAYERRMKADNAAATQRADPKFERYVRRCFKKAKARLGAQMENGAGLPVDDALRAHLLEVNSRSWNHGLDSFPASFNIIEAFLQRDEKLAYFRLRKEIDHLVSFPRFFDYLTEAAGPDAARELMDVTEYGTVYSFNATNPFHDMLFQGTRSRDEFVVAGASLVRHGTELSMMVLTGQLADLEAQTQIVRDFENLVMTPGKEQIKADDSWERRAEPLLSSTDYWRCIVLLRFDLESEVRDATYVCHDNGDHYTITTDDPTIFMGPEGLSCPEEEARKHVEKISEYEPLIEIARACLHLPMMFNDLAEDVAIERHETELRSKFRKLSWRMDSKLVAPHDRVGYRNVATLADAPAHRPDRFGFTSPTMKMDVSGYWKKLPFGTIGKDRRGGDTHGRTWVERELRWHESPPPGGVATTSRSPEGATGANPGNIYIMRSAAHAKDVFKVGLTRRSPEERAAELSRTTSAPDHFLVVQEWYVEDCVAAERLAHERLNDFRLSDRREFFRLPLSELQTIIAEIVESQRTEGR